jgi:hypothetical protein
LSNRRDFLPKGLMDANVSPGAKGTSMDRRTALAILSGAIGGAATGRAAAEREGNLQSTAPKPHLRKIATEEAFIIPEIAAAVRDVVRQGGPNLDLKLLRLIYDAPADTAPTASAPPGTRDALARTFLPRLLDIGQGRLAEMDSNGVDMHLLSLTVPGVQMFAPANAVAYARLSNDRRATACGVTRHDSRDWRALLHRILRPPRRKWNARSPR